MDPSVVAALAKWPDVPDVYGWLGLTARGEWRLKGEPIGNAALREFIGRNYAADERGRWYFQNGPQRVYVELAATPWIWRVGWASAPELTAHTGVRARRLHGAWLDEAGRLSLATDLGFGLVDSTDSTTAAHALVADDRTALATQLEALCRGEPAGVVVRGAALGLDGDARLEALRWSDAPRRFKFDPSPRAT
ncbi:MAG TPA: DUF2946 family protein [Burkholderiaceae bacterium]|nr:DUF2946 family protein [Burkholderiaceae bacterium]